MIFNRQAGVGVDQKALETFLRKVMREIHAEKQELAICFVTDAEIARWNHKYRGKNRPTDVLSFPAQPRANGHRKFSRTELQRKGYLGDIAIAPATARNYAKQNGRTLDDELRVLIVHGVLHLLGFDHESDDGEMERLEHRLRRHLGLEK